MRLKHIKLSGFKSFVDTTKVAMPGNLVGIVGPNGCGKSNVIDAVRWVMGESSAKTLRGDSMEDVIFNGSATRKPVSKAYVELVFDNKSGKAPGAYAKYAEISIKRELVREGGSKYFINGVKSRRKDISDIFLGTGLGPRSYSIIEQGMVGRIVESKPEDLRVLIEEAAGISKYKDRRRDTGNRMRHTVDNLSRVEDIVGELETQLRRLKRQANAAERYKVLKEELRQHEQWQATLKWSSMDDSLQKKAQDLSRLETELDMRLSEQRSAESDIETMRETQVELTEAMNLVQAEFYQLGGEVTALEQQILHSRETRQQQQAEQQRLVSSQSEAEAHLYSDRQRLEETVAQLEEVAPQAEEQLRDHQSAMQRLMQAEKEHGTWQNEWESLSEESMAPEKERGVQAALLDSLQNSITTAVDRRNRAQGLLSEIESNIDVQQIEQQKQQADNAQAAAQQLEEQLAELDEQVQSARADIERLRDSYNSVRHRLQGDKARLNSLQEMRERLLGADDKALNQWLVENGLDQAPRLLDKLQVESGWESAVENLLSDHLTAIQVDSLSSMAELADTIDGFAVTAFQSSNAAVSGSAKHPRLLDKVSASINLQPWLADIYAAETLAEALSWQADLASHEIIITAAGEVVGSDWLSIGQASQNGQGLIRQEAEIETLTKSVATNEAECERVQQRGEKRKEELQQLEQQRQQLRESLREQSRQAQVLQNEYARTEAKNSEWITRREQLSIELTELAQEIVTNEQAQEEARDRLEKATQAAHEFDQRRVELTKQREQVRDGLQVCREEEQKAREAMQELQVQQQSLISTQQSLEQSIQRLQGQQQQQQQRLMELQTLLEEEDPAQALNDKLNELLEKRLVVEKQLSQKRSDLADHENRLREISQQRSGFDQQAQAARASLEQLRIEQNERTVRRDTVAEQLEKDEAGMRELVEALPEELTLQAADEQIESLRGRIDRIGPVNLVAIEEYEECAERSEYLNKQREDLLNALETLQDAINKIDRETKTRFKETFEKLNAGFQAFFPKLFGDGKAYLELTDNDMLTTGVAVMARPPGKRNSTIHLLSGGEKALTAVALIFAFFELNPAPFCVLDEVDAPLDDANVERYSKVLQQLSDKTQLLFITHNKITMEVADILVGVTMAEPGSSRIVQVDVEEAASMAAS